MKKFLATTLLGACLLALGASATAQVREQTVKFATVLNADHPQGLSMVKFAEIVAAKSGGKIKVKTYFGGSLGNDVSFISQLQGGVLEMAVPECSTLVGIKSLKEFGLLNLPLLFNDSKEADAVLDGPFGKRLLAKLPENGLVGLGFWENGFRHVTNSKRAINTVDDLAGLKLRVIQNPLFIDTFSTLGVNAVPMPWPEVYPGLESKAIDGQENPLPTLVSSKLYEVQGHAVLSGHVYSAWMMLMGKKFWDKLNPEEQQLISDAAKEVQVFERAAIRSFADKSLAELKGHGMKVTTLAPAERQKMKDKLQPVWAKFSADFGAEGAALLSSELAKTRAK
jgi:tripartite ATP-independent transporter DctP family solute receptor